MAGQDRTLKDRARTMTMAALAAADYGNDVNVRTKESSAQDFGDGIYSCYFYKSIIFLIFCGCSCVHNRKAPKGGYGGVQGFQAACKPHDTMGVLKLKYYTF